ncbi:MAG: hypothetical protein F6K55_03205 [Moorea sp. SIO4A3]|nr:hypothetical protein [Moorena sp. SIO4A3]
MTNNTARANNYIQQLIIQRLNLTLVDLCDRENNKQRHAIDHNIQMKALAVVHFGGALEQKTRKLANVSECLEYAQNSDKKSDKEDIPFFKGRVKKFEQEVKELTDLTKVAEQELVQAKQMLEDNRTQAHQFSYGLRASFDDVEL